MGSYHCDPARIAEVRAALADAYELKLPQCGICGDRMYPGDRFARRFVSGEETVLCRYCLSSAIMDLEVLEE